MRNTFSRFCVTCGVFLVLAGAYLHLFNRAQNREAGNASAMILTAMKNEILSDSPAASECETGPTTSLTDEYLGYISIPALELELPVLSDWDYEKLKQAPCRFSGSPWEGNLVIMAHNYDHHFGKLSSLSSGDTVFFTDPQGLTIQFRAVATDIVPPTAVTEVTSGCYDLALFTCTYGGKNRVVIYCEKVVDTEKVPDEAVRHVLHHFRLYSSIS